MARSGKLVRTRTATALVRTSEMPLHEFLRWLASTLERGICDEVYERAVQAEALIEACALAASANTNTQRREAAEACERAIAKAKAQ